MNYVAYFRVSTKSQSNTGNGLDIQKNELAKFAKNRGGEIVSSFEEVISGSKAQRIELAKALDLCKKMNYTLLVHKIDRLSRESTLIETLRNEKINFVFANMPDANPLTIDLLLTIAKHERTTINERTTAGKKATIEKYGTLHHKKGTALNMTKEKQATAVVAIKAKASANENNKKALAFIAQVKHLKNANILDIMQKAGFKTSKGKELSLTHIARFKKALE